jgi:hypothetical protein
MCKGWDKFDEVKMGIIVRHIKRYVEHHSFVGPRFTTRAAPAFPIMCSILENVNPNQLLRKGRNKLRCVTCEKMVTALLIPCGHPTLACREDR